MYFWKQIIVEGIPVSSSSINRRFRGFIAIDELNFADSSECGAFCTFEAGTCGWSQEENDDDFNWILVSSSWPIPYCPYNIIKLTYNVTSSS